MSVRSLFACGFACALSSLGLMAQDKDKPNFIIIFCDDLGYGDLSCFGNPTIKTPHLDQMAQEGQKWTSFCVSASVSSPSRGGLLTGRLGVRTGLYGNSARVLHPNSCHGMPAEEITLAEQLKKAQYTTACVGKWHLGHQAESLPLQHGFDVFFGFPFSNDMSKTAYPKYPYDYLLYDQEEVIEKNPDQTQLTKRLTEKTVELIEQNKEKPFFIYLAHPMPHWPVYSSEAFQNRSARGAYGDCIEELDWSVAQILEKLKQTHLDEKTLVIFTSDNGPWLSYKTMGGSAGPLREGKASVCEGGFRVPCIMWGGMVQAGMVTDMGSTLDLFTTFSEMAGIPLPAEREYDGVSLCNVLAGEGKSQRESFFYYRGGELYAVRLGDFKMYTAYKAGYGGGPKQVFEQPELYHLGSDVAEQFNVAKQHLEKVQEMQDLLKQHLATLPKAEPLFDAREAKK